ncbi:MAG: hypothetical protein GY788_18470, partial [bacterium]|nr:hypothetical protein [bacterium]
TAEYLGSETILGLRSKTGKEIRAIASGDYPVPVPGSVIKLGAAPERFHVFDLNSGRRVDCRK